MVCNGQNSGQLLLMNGRLLEVQNFNDTAYTDLRYDFDRNQFKRLKIDIRQARKLDGVYQLGMTSEKGKEIMSEMRASSIDRDEVFSFTSDAGEEKLFYYYDEPLGNVATEEEMRAIVIGQRDARLNVNGNAWLYSGLAVGFATGYAARGSVLALAVPPIFALSARIPIVKIKGSHIQDPKYKYNEDYAVGYERYARGIFTRKALIGSAIGTALGLLTYTVVDNN
jgi:hypothetical protein